MVWCNLGLNPGLPDHWRTLYPLGQQNFFNKKLFYWFFLSPDVVFPIIWYPTPFTSRAIFLLPTVHMQSDVFIVTQCKVFYYWLLIDCFNVDICKHHKATPLDCRIVSRLFCKISLLKFSAELFYAIDRWHTWRLNYHVLWCPYIWLINLFEHSLYFSC